MLQIQFVWDFHGHIEFHGRPVAAQRKLFQLQQQVLGQRAEACGSSEGRKQMVGLIRIYDYKGALLLGSGLSVDGRAVELLDQLGLRECVQAIFECDLRTHQCVSRPKIKHENINNKRNKQIILIRLTVEHRQPLPRSNAAHTP